MAKKSKIAKNEQRKAIVARHAEERARLKTVVVSPKSSAEEKAAAVSTLQALPRDASPTRVRNRDVADGRPRGYLRKFGLSRVRMRQLAHNGELPGVSKSS
jgi:small subunit ribosomal protein S14